MSWNIRDRIEDKANKFEIADFIKKFQNADILCLQETKGPVKLENYLAFNSNRKQSRSGGVAILVKSNIRKGVTQIKINETPDAIAIRLNKSFFKLTFDVYIICFYISPYNSKYTKSNTDYTEKMFQHLETITSRLYDKGQVILCGDANSRTGCLPDYLTENDSCNTLIDCGIDPFTEPDIPEQRNNQDNETNQYCNLFLDLITTIRLRILNGRTLGDCQGNLTCFKYNGCSLVDYFVASPCIRPSIRSLQVQDLNSYSDHCPLLLKIGLKIQYKCLTPLFDFSKMPPKFKWCEEASKQFRDAQNNSEVTQGLNQILLKGYPNNKTGNEQLTNEFTKAVQAIAMLSLKPAHIPTKLPHKKWFDRDCKTSKQNLNRLARNYSSHPSCTTIRSLYFSERNKHNTLMKQKRTSFLARLNESIEQGHALDWKKFKQLKQTNDNKVLLDKYDLLSFYEYFTDLYRKRDSTDTEFNEMTRQYKDSYKNEAPENSKILNEEISITELQDALQKLHIGKSTNEDLISNEMLKNLCPLGLQCMLKIFNHCMDNGLYPWHTSIITPIFKAGDPYNPDNYRAIAVGSCLGKLFSSILLGRLTSFKQQYCNEPIEQLGFKKGAQTNDHILTLKTLIDKYTKKQKTRLFTCFVDLKKAFDTVSRDLLLYKLVKLNIRGQFFTVIEDMYNHSLSKIKINNLLSGDINMDRGTEQGHPLSPDLFKLFIKDLSDLFYVIGEYPYLDDFIVTHLLWADDLVLLALDTDSLQANINVLHNFCTKWGLSINIKKTKTLLFGRSIPHSYYTACYIGEEVIENVESYCYLGIVFHKSGNFKIATNELRKKALRALFGLKKNVIRSTLSIKSLFILFDSLIKPVFLYGCQVLAPHNDLTKYLIKDICKNSTGEAFLKRISKDPYEKFHLRYLKWCLSVHPKASNIGCWGETGRYPLQIDAMKMSVDYFIRVKNSEPSSLLHAAFLEQEKLKLEWYSNTQSFIDIYACGPYKHPSVNSRNVTQTLFKDKWKDAKAHSPKLEFYNIIKNEFGIAKYLYIKNDKHRFALSRLRISAHNLYIERGRYKNPPVSRDDRICMYCKHNYNTNMIESESHVLDDCALYNSVRTTICSSIQCKTLTDLIADAGNDGQLSTVAGEAAYRILEMHKAFTGYYESNPENFLTSTGKFMFL